MDALKIFLNAYGRFMDKKYIANYHKEPLKFPAYKKLIIDIYDLNTKELIVSVSINGMCITEEEENNLKIKLIEDVIFNILA